MKDDEIYTKEEQKLYKLIENQEITETQPAELERQRDFLLVQKAKKAINNGLADKKEIENLLNSIDE